MHRGGVRLLPFLMHVEYFIYFEISVDICRNQMYNNLC